MILLLFSVNCYPVGLFVMRCSTTLSTLKDLPFPTDVVSILICWYMAQSHESATDTFLTGLKFHVSDRFLTGMNTADIGLILF